MSESVTLYQGGQYWLYKYRRYDDVRLVLVPERGIAAFGGDPDNFQFPRWALDVSMLRAYENGKPAKTPNHLDFNWAGAQEGEAVFVSGHPGNTDRLLTVAELVSDWSFESIWQAERLWRGEVRYLERLQHLRLLPQPHRRQRARSLSRRRVRVSAPPRRCSPITAGSTSTGAAPPVSRPR